ncbi:unnamed protein product [Heterosigma akashiwo]
MSDNDYDMKEDGEEPTSTRRVAVRTKGRGHRGTDRDERYSGRGGEFESVDVSGSAGPAKSVEGWLVFVGACEEAQEDDLHAAFAEYGEVKNLHVNLDRRTGRQGICPH